MFDSFEIAAIFAAFLVAGAVKGVIGFGLPTVGLGLLSVALELSSAMALLVIPSLVTNLWQAAGGREGIRVASRIWPFLIAAGASVWLGAEGFHRIDAAVLLGLLGVLVAAYGGCGIAGFRPSLTRSQERWLGPPLGVVNGILTGLTGSFVVPGVMYLQALGLSRDALVQAMGMLFSVSTVALAFALYEYGLLYIQLATASALALVPAIAGMALGWRLRRRISEAAFLRWFYVALIALGGCIVASAVA